MLILYELIEVSIFIKLYLIFKKEARFATEDDIGMSNDVLFLKTAVTLLL